MKITDISIDNKTSVFVLVFIIAIMGFISYVSLPREASPDIAIPLVIISTPYPGVSPEDIESLVTTPIEKEVKKIAEVKKIQSSSFEGYSLIQVEFQSGYDIEDALQKVREKVNKAETEIPADATKPEIVEINFSEFPILTFELSGPTGLSKLKDIAEELKDKIETIKGVLEVKVNGGLEREVQVDVDYRKLQHYNIRFDDIIAAVRDENKTIPGGTIDVNQSSFLVRVPGEFKTPYPLENIIVKTKEGEGIALKDVATLTYGFKERTSFARTNNIEAISIQISKRSGENIIRIAEEVKQIIKEKEAQLPDDINLTIVTDQSEEIDKQVKELENNIFSGLVLVIGILFFALGMRNAILVGISIPLSMLISFFILQMMDITLNFVVLFALILALGMLVDNAIVILENIQKFLEEGYNKIDAAKKATAEVAWPVASSTLTTVAAFFPLLFWPGVTGDFMYYIPMTVIVTLSSSLFVALVINPVFAEVFVKHESHGKPVLKKSVLGIISYPFDWGTYIFVDKMLPVVLKYYEKLLDFSLGEQREKGKKISLRTWLGILAFFGMFFVEGILAQFFPLTVEIILTAILGILVVLIFKNIRLRFIFAAFISLFFITQLYGAFGFGVEFFPDVEPRRVYIKFEAPTGTGIKETNEIINRIEKKILTANFKDIEKILAVAGASTNPFDAGAATPNKGTITVEYIDYENRNKSSKETTEEIRKLVEGTPGAAITIAKEEMGPPVGLPVNIEVSGEDYNEIGKLTAKIRDYLKDVPGLVDVDDDYDAGKPELRVVIDRKRAAVYGMNTSLIASTVRTAINGTEASKYRVNEDEYDITVRLRKDQRSSVDALKNLLIIFNNQNGKTLSVPLSSVANVFLDRGPGAIKRKDLKRVITITGDAAEGFNANAVLDQVKAKMGEYQLPQGYSVSFTGQSQEQEEASAFLGKAFGIAILLIFLILVIQFNSVSQPFIIMTAVLISLVGVFIGLLAFKMPFGIVMTGIGVISLAGVVVNNNIVLIDYMNLLKKRDFALKDIAKYAGLRRFRPVTLTAVTTILGLIPLSFGFGFDIYTGEFVFGGESAEFWKSMGIAVIFGLGFATFLTLILVPVFFMIWEELGDAFKSTFSRSKNEPAPKKPEANENKESHIFED
ncbi:MAG: efflux RND transporter permease subunit [Ignavibacteria bacterium]|nr:efflux RND transporter permease subunit [Ignavibacteria bacterium]